MIEGITLEKKENYAILMVDVPKTRNALSVPIVEYRDYPIICVNLLRGVE